ncbi:hypothetical protein [Actinoplanes awajinensis]|nr:hypothetical protein [Actinoplanes awajinensis]
MRGRGSPRPAGRTLALLVVLLVTRRPGAAPLFPAGTVAVS